MQVKYFVFIILDAYNICSIILYITHEGKGESQFFQQYFYVSGSEINYFRDKDKLYELYTRLENNPYINKGTLDFWYIKFQNWLSEESEYLLHAISADEND